MTTTNPHPNPELLLAEEFALYTSKSFFLTGKAGTGKTTLLKKIAEQTTKNYAIVAPTGVAAINAGGVTIHSLFMLPISAFIPSNDDVDMNIVMNRKVFRSNFRFRDSKRKVLQELELLIIDEVSMVRCDTLDAIDFTLRQIRKINRPFGGVQIILIGDMFQLPPVIRDHEWSILKNYYASPYFFDAEVWKQVNPAHIELQKIYRQQDAVFIRILNNIRNRKMEAADYSELEKRYHPDFKPTEEGYVLLCTHNRKVDQVNEYELNKLPGKMYSYEAEILDDFPENMYPCELILNLKPGAQVMFIKNDKDGDYFNGKLAKVLSIDDSGIAVVFNDSHTTYYLKKDSWENVNYSADAVTGKFSRNVMGEFLHYPLRLAWAITIHKSQGLTFDKVIIDAGASFATGQVYVALSRCRSLEGIVLHSRIHQQVLFGDDKINSFTETRDQPDVLENTLVDAKRIYESELLKRVFGFSKFLDYADEWEVNIETKTIPDKTKVLEKCKELKLQIQKIIEVAEKFNDQLQRLIDSDSENSGNINLLKERCYKAIDYFSGEIYNNLVIPVQMHINDFAYKSKVKRYLQHVQILENQFWNCIQVLYHVSFMNEKLYTGEIKYAKELNKPAQDSTTVKTKVKGNTYQDTLDLYKAGKTIDEIAAVRSLTNGTIKSHIAKWIGQGKIDILDIMPKEKVLMLENLLAENGSGSLTALKPILGDDMDYSELRMVTHYMNFKKSKEASLTMHS